MRDIREFPPTDKCICNCAFVPHEWLFQRAACAVLHGGSGTSASTDADSARTELEEALETLDLDSHQHLLRKDNTHYRSYLKLVRQRYPGLFMIYLHRLLKIHRKP